MLMLSRVLDLGAVGALLMLTGSVQRVICSYVRKIQVILQFGAELAFK